MFSRHLKMVAIIVWFALFQFVFNLLWCQMVEFVTKRNKQTKQILDNKGDMFDNL